MLFEQARMGEDGVLVNDYSKKVTVTSTPGERLQVNYTGINLNNVGAWVLIGH